MFPNLRILKIQGISLYIHWTFWLLPLWIIFFFGGSSVFPLWMHLLLVAALFVCVVLHEFGHALMAKRFGIRTRSITLSPLGGIAQLERMSHKPMEEFLIAIAGPAVNVVIAAVLAAILAVPTFLAPALVETLAWKFVGLLFLMNVIMVVFNMIPAFPMDGGRVLRAILASGLGLLKGTRVAVIVGAVFASLIGFVGFFILHNPWTLLIALFVIFAGQQELAALEEEERHRLAMEDDEFGPRQTMHVTLRLWDPVRQAWVLRSYGGSEREPQG